MLAITASVIREVIPDAKIIADVSDPYCFEFTETFLNSVDKKDIDVFSFHAYSAVPEFRYRSAVELLRKMLDTRGMQHVELWQGEGGYPSWAYKGHWLAPETGCDSERSQAVWQLRRFFLDVYNGIKLSSFFMMADVWEKPYAKAVEVLEKPAAHGILNGLTYTPKKSYETIKNAAAIFSEDIKSSAEYIQTDIKGASALELLSCVNMSFEKDGNPIYVYYLPTEVHENTETSYRVEVNVYTKLSAPVLVDPYTADVYEIDDITCELGVTRYKNLPIKDYPLIVTNRDTFAIES